MTVGIVSSSCDGFDQIVGWDSKIDGTTHWVYLWTGGQDKTLTVTRGFREPVEIVVAGGGGGGSWGNGGSGGGVVHKTDWTFYKKETWTIPYAGSAGQGSTAVNDTNGGGTGTKTRLQNAANSAYIEAQGGEGGRSTSTSSGTTSIVYESGIPAFGFGGISSSNSGGSGCVAYAPGADGGAGYQVSWWTSLWLGAGGGGYAGWGYGQPFGGGNGTFGGGVPPTSANGFAFGSGGGAAGSIYNTAGNGANGAIMVRVPKVLA